MKFLPNTRRCQIVVGDGTAGLAVAARLSQGLLGTRILVVEAGPAAPDELRILVPGRKGTTLGIKYDWDFTKIPPHLASRVIGVNKGHVLGGSSAISLLCWVRAAAAAAEFDREYLPNQRGFLPVLPPLPLVSGALGQSLFLRNEDMAVSQNEDSSLIGTHHRMGGSGKSRMKLEDNGSRNDKGRERHRGHFRLWR